MRRRFSEREVAIPIGRQATLQGTLTTPPEAAGLVLFAHGSGSSRHSPRNRRVAERLQEAGLATLLFDLLTAAEESIDLRTGQLRFDIPFLATRLGRATDWALASPEAVGLPIGYFGSSTGAAAALRAAAARSHSVHCVVSRGGRPDLAGDALPRVRAPTLLIVGSEDSTVLELNRAAMARMEAPVKLEIVRGATHLFEEPGALERVADLAAEWLHGHLVGVAAKRQEVPA